MRKITVKLLKKLPEKYITTGIILVLALFFYGVIGSHFIMGLNLIDSVYYSVITMATVGYGDLYPISNTGRVISIISSLVGIAIIALPSGVITAGYLDEIRERKIETSDHEESKE